MSYKPTIVFVPGAWHTPGAFKKVIDNLKTHGYECVGLHLPSVGGDPVVGDMEPDKDLIRSTVTKLADEDKDVIVVAHSYGGVPANSALEGLNKTERVQAGKPGGVIRLCMISAFLFDVGGYIFSGGSERPWYRIEGEVLITEPKHDVLYTDLPAEEVAYWHSTLLPMARVCCEVGASYAAWKIIPVSYLLCEKDQAIPLEFQQKMVDDAREAGGNVETETIDASHSPFLSKPEETALWIRRAAREVGLEAKAQ